MTDATKEKRTRLDRRTIRVILARVHIVVGIGFLLYSEGIGIQHIFSNPTLCGWLNILLGPLLWWSKFPPALAVAVKMLSLAMLLTMTWVYLDSGLMTALIYGALGWSALEGIYLAGLELFKKGPRHASRPD